MKGSSNIVSSVHNIRQALEHFESFQREYPETKGARLFKGYGSRLEWIVKDLITHPLLTEEVRQGVKEEWESDVFSVPAINEKVALLNPQNRETIEQIVDAMLNGEEITFESKKEEVNY